jgi:hypothetical protein
LLLAVQNDGHRTIINQFNLHGGLKNSFCRMNVLPAKQFYYLKIRLSGLFGVGSANEGRTPPFSTIGVKGELRNHEDGPADILNREIHLAGSILKYSQGRNFLGNITGIGFLVIYANAEQHKQSLTDFCNGVTRNSNPGTLYPLNHRPHDFIIS